MMTRVVVWLKEWLADGARATEYMTSWIDDRAIIELFHRKSRVIPVPGRGWDNFCGEKGDYRIQYTLIPGLSRHKSLARSANACTYEGFASRTNTLKREFSISRFAKALPAVPPGLCTSFLFSFKLRFGNLPPMTTKLKGKCFWTSSSVRTASPGQGLRNASVTRNTKGSMLNVIRSLTFYG